MHLIYNFALCVYQELLGTIRRMLHRKNLFKSLQLSHCYNGLPETLWII
jgi:hypothetical protein